MIGILSLLMIIESVLAGPAAMNLQGRLFDVDGEVVNTGTLPVTLEVRDPSGECLLFQEEHSVNMASSDGFFSVVLGKGNQNTSTAPSFGFSQALSNAEVLNHPEMDCAGNSYSPLADHSRVVRVIVDGQALTPDQRIQASAYSINSNALNGKSASEFIQDDGGNVTQSSIASFFDAASTLTTSESLRWNGSSWEVFTPGSASAVTAVSSANSYISIANGTTAPELTLNVGSATNTVAAGDDPRFPSSGCASGSFMRWDGSAWQCEADTDTNTTYSPAVALGADGLLTGSDKNKLDNIATGAEVNVNADWLAGSGDAQILNKPTIPSSLADIGVTNSDNITEGSTNLFLSLAEQTKLLSLDAHSLNAADGSPIDALAIDNDGNVGIGTTSPGSIFEISSGSTYFGVNGSSFRIDPYRDGVTESLYIRPRASQSPLRVRGESGQEGLFVDSIGRVGVGTNSPARIVHIYRGSGNVLPMIESGTGIGGLQVQSNTTGQRALVQMVDGDGGNWEINSTDGDFEISDNGIPSERIVIKGTSGDVGVGVTIPLARLHVRDDSSTPDTTDAILSEAIIDSGFRLETRKGIADNSADAIQTSIGMTYSGTENAMINFHRGSTNIGGYLSFATNDGREQVRINRLGNVGVGTTSPTEKLEVLGNIKGTELCIGSDCRSTWPSAGVGTVTSIASGTGLTGGPVTGVGTLNVDVGETAGKILAADDVTQCTAGQKLQWTTGSGWSCVSDVDTNTTYSNATSGVAGLMSTGDKSKLDNIAAGAEVNVNADWSAGSGDAQILNKPTIPSAFSLNAADGDPVDALFVDNVGNVGIGTASPAVTLDLSSRVDALAVPKGTTAQAPDPANQGWIRFNTTTSMLEVFNGSIWTPTNNAVAPAGQVSAFPMSTCPNGWLEANGGSVATADYPDLFSAIGYTYGGSGASFLLPDYRGQFLRGWDHGAGVDLDAASRTNRGDGTVGNSVGTRQADMFASHSHNYYDYYGSWSGGRQNSNPYGYLGSTLSYTLRTSTANGGSETRPKNVNVIYCVSTAVHPTTTIAAAGSGTASYVPQFTSATALADSPIAINGGNVGVGTSSPQTTLDVNGSISSQGPAGEAVKGGITVNTGSIVAVANYDTSEFVEGTGWDASTGVFTAPVSGRFFVICHIYCGSISGGARVMIYKNGLQRRAGATSVVNGVGHFAQVTSMVNLSVGDTVDCRIGNNTGTNMSSVTATMEWSKIP